MAREPGMPPHTPLHAHGRPAPCMRASSVSLGRMSELEPCSSGQCAHECPGIALNADSDWHLRAGPEILRL